MKAFICTVLIGGLVGIFLGIFSKLSFGLIKSSDSIVFGSNEKETNKQNKRLENINFNKDELGQPYHKR